jgi:hypothetical protein
VLKKVFSRAFSTLRGVVAIVMVSRIITTIVPTAVRFVSVLKLGW